MRRPPGHVGAVEPDAPDRRRDHAGDRGGQRALARAVGAEHGHRLAGLDHQVHTEQGPGAVVGDLQALDLEPHALGHGARPEVGGLDDVAGCDLGRRALRDHLAEVEHGDPVRQRQHHLDVVLDQHHRDALLGVDRAQARRQHRGLVGVEPGRRLVEEQHPGTGGERPAQLDEPTGAERERAGPHRGQPGEAEQVEDAVDRIVLARAGPADRARGRRAPCGRRRCAVRLRCATTRCSRTVRLGEQLEPLERARQPGAGPPLRRRRGHVDAVDRAPARRGAGRARRARRSMSSCRRRSGR